MSRRSSRVSRDESAAAYLSGLSEATKVECHEVKCPTIGTVSVIVQGKRSPNEVVILTVPDLGCDPDMYLDFIIHPLMRPIRERTVWMYVMAPGQQPDAPDLPSDYHYPSMIEIGEDLIHVIDHLQVKQVVCFGEGAGANIMARFAMAHNSRVLGMVLLHATGSAASIQESVKEKLIRWNLKELNSSAENYLMLHRFGHQFRKANNDEEIKSLIEIFQENLHSKRNVKNLKKFVESFLKRRNIADNAKSLSKSSVLLITGELSIFNETTKSLFNAISKCCEDKTKVELVEVSETGNVLEEKPEKLVESLQYFLQGLGLVSSAPMLNVPQSVPGRDRRLSMEDSDRPFRERTGSQNSNQGMSRKSSDCGMSRNSSDRRISQTSVESGEHKITIAIPEHAVSS